MAASAGSHPSSNANPYRCSRCPLSFSVKKHATLNTLSSYLKYLFFKKEVMRIKTKKKIFTYLAFLIAFSSIFYALILRAGTLAAAGGVYVFGLMWMPGFSAILTQLIFEHSLRGLGWKLGRFKYLLIGYCLPIFYGLVVYGITWASGLGSFNREVLIANTSGFFTDLPQIWRSVIYFGYLGVLGVFSGLLSGTGEEIGWRGLLFPELKKLFSFNQATLITGAIWTLWHLPLILFADYITPGIPRWYGGYHVYFYGHRLELRFQLAAQCFRELLAGRAAACQPQPVYPGHIYAADPAESYHTLHHR